MIGFNSDLLFFKGNCFQAANKFAFFVSFPLMKLFRVGMIFNSVVSDQLNPYSTAKDKTI